MFSMQEKMKKLARRIERAVNGESAPDIAVVMAALIAFEICDSTPDLEKRQRFLERLVEFMRGRIRDRRCEQ